MGENKTTGKQPGMDLTSAQWHLMECLWEKVPRTGREVVDYLKAERGM